MPGLFCERNLVLHEEAHVEHQEKQMWRALHLLLGPHEERWHLVHLGKPPAEEIAYARVIRIEAMPFPFSDPCTCCSGAQ